MSSRAWIIAAAGGLSLALMGAGGALALRTLSAGDTSAPAGAEGCCDNPAVHDRKGPAAFGLPTYPAASDFHSMEIDRTVGSVSFSVKKGSAGAIAGFYRDELPGRGWTMEWERPTQEPAQAPGEKQPRMLKGGRQSWASADDRELLLLALDFPQKRSAAQAVLSWAPKDAKKK